MDNLDLKYIIRCQIEDFKNYTKEDIMNFKALNDQIYCMEEKKHRFIGKLRKMNKK